MRLTGTTLPLILAGALLAVALTGCGATSEGQPSSPEAEEETNVAAESGSAAAEEAATTESEGTASEGTAAAENEESVSGGGQEGTEGAEEMRIRITAEGHTITAMLYDNAAARQLYDSLPVTYPMMNLYGREMCYRMGAGSLPTDEAADTGYAVGDISYWPPAGSLVILYKQNGEVFEQQPIGHTDDDISCFDGMADTDITWEKAE